MATSGTGDDAFEAYCYELESTAAWGGQVELQVRWRAALALLSRAALQRGAAGALRPPRPPGPAAAAPHPGPACCAAALAQALARALQCHIQVHSVGLPLVELGEEFKSELS